MSRLAAFTAGVAVGWISRSTVDSSHDAVVKLVSLGYAAAARARRILALERELLDDLIAEARAHVTPEPPPKSHDGAPSEHEQVA
jgi:hypothetical protein